MSYNGKAFNQFNVARTAAYVYQGDNHIAQMTCRCELCAGQSEAAVCLGPAWTRMLGAADSCAAQLHTTCAAAAAAHSGIAPIAHKLKSCSSAAAHVRSVEQACSV